MYYLWIWPCLGVRPAPQFLLLFCSSALLWWDRGKEAGRQEGLEHKCTGVQDCNRENRSFYSNQHFPAFVCEILRWPQLSVEQCYRGNNDTIIFWPNVANSRIFLENCCYFLKISPHLKQLDCCTLLCSRQLVTNGHSKFRCLGNPAMYLLPRSYISQRCPSLLLAVVWIGLRCWEGRTESSESTSRDGLCFSPTDPWSM